MTMSLIKGRICQVFYHDYLAFEVNINLECAYAKVSRLSGSHINKNIDKYIFKIYPAAL